MPMSATPKSARLSEQSNQASQTNQAIVMVAVYEIIKGAGAFLLPGLVWQWHDKLPQWVDQMTRLLQHLMETLFAPQLHQLTQLADKDNANWRNAFFVVVAYELLRFIESYGLYHDKTWAYWYSVLGYGIFVPVELYYFIVEPIDWLHLGVLVLNVVIVIVVYCNMKRKHLL